MKKIKQTKEIYTFTLSEILKALNLKVQKNKKVIVNNSFDIDNNKEIVEIEVFD